MTVLAKAIGIAVVLALLVLGMYGMGKMATCVGKVHVKIEGRR